MRGLIGMAAMLMGATASAGEVLLAASNPEGVSLPAWPVAVGVPFPVGELADAERVAVVDANGRAVPAQITVGTRWWARGGSVQTLLVRFVADPQAKGYRLVHGEGAPANPASDHPVSVTRDGDLVTVTNGPLALRFAREAGGPVESISYDANRDGRFDETETALGAGGLFELAAAGDTAPPTSIEVEEDGPVRAMVAVRGRLGTGGAERLSYVLRLQVWAGWPAVLADCTLTQDTGRVFADVDGIELRFGLPRGGKEVRTDGGEAFSLGAGDDLRLLQLGPERAQTIAGLDNPDFVRINDERKTWRSPEEDGLWERDERRKAFEATWSVNGEERGWGARTNGLTTVTSEGRPWSLTAAVRWFWQLHPKSVSVGPEGLSLGLLPKVDRPHHIHLGTAKTHTVLLAFHGADDVQAAEEYRRGLDRPPMFHPSPQWMCASGVWGPIRPKAPGQFRYYEDRVEDWVDGQFVNSVERSELYGVWDYGDLLYSGGQWLNMETALDYGLFVQFLRTGERKYWDYFERAINHFRDVDTSRGELAEGQFDYGLWLMPGYMPEKLARECARDDEVGEKLRADLFYYLGDQPPPMGGLRRHSFSHYQNAGFTPAALDTKDEYKRGRLYGGTCTIGGHGWFIGTIAHHMLTGDPYSLETAKLSGELILAKLTALGEGRDNWKMIDVVHMYRLTGDGRYLDLAKRGFEYHWEHRHEITDRVEAQQEGRLMSPYYTIGQFIRDYVEVTGDEDVRQRFVAMIREWLDAVEETKVETSVGPVWSYLRDFLDSRCHGDFADLAFCYEATGDRSFIDRTLPDFDLYMNHGYHSTAFFEVPRIMVSLAKLGLDPLDRPWRGTIGTGETGRAWATKAEGQPLKVWVSQQSGYRVRSEPLEGKAELTGPEGVVASHDIVRGGLDAFTLGAPPEAPAGTYRVDIRAPKQQFQLTSDTPLSNAPPAEAVQTPDGGGAKLVDLARLRYAAQGNVPYERGTIEFAVQPLWEDTAARREAVPYHYHQFFDSRDGEYDYGLTVYVWDGGEVNAGRSLIAAWADKDLSSNVSCACPWKAGEWHAVAFTWERTGEGVGTLALYVDGQKVGEQKDAPHFPSRLADLFLLGCNSTYSPNTSMESVLAWMRISDVVRQEFPEGQPVADEHTTFLATLDGGPPFAADVARGASEAR
jgi:hypothetical protein